MAIVGDDFQIAVFIQWTEYKKQKMRIINSEMPFNVRCLFLKNSRGLPGVQFTPVIVNGN